MNPALREGENLEETVTVTLTRRDILLLKLGLELVDRDYTKAGVLLFDIRSLRHKLSHESGKSR